MINFILGAKLEDKDKVIKYLKDEIEELSKPKETSVDDHVFNNIQITKLQQDIVDLEKNVEELKLQISEMEINENNLHKQVIIF